MYSFFSAVNLTRLVGLKRFMVDKWQKIDLEARMSEYGVRNTLSD
jgi:hypothetical protein